MAGSTNFGTPIVDPVPLQNLYDNLVSIHSYQSLPSFTSPQPLNPLISPSYIDIISPQVLTLVNLLLGYRESTNFHAIIFVERRIYAGIISDLLGKVGELKDWIRCGWLVGHGGTKQDEDGEYRGLKVKEVSVLFLSPFFLLKRFVDRAFSLSFVLSKLKQWRNSEVVNSIYS